MAALMAAQGGAADQKIANYKNAIAEQAQMQKLLEERRQFDEQQAQHNRLTDAQIKNYDAEREDRATRRKVDERDSGIGLKPPPELLHPKNGGKRFGPAELATQALGVAQWYAERGADAAAERYTKIAQRYEALANNADKNALGRERLEETRGYHQGLLQYRKSALEGVMARFNAAQRQQASLFGQRLQAQADIAKLNRDVRTYVAQLAGAIRMSTNDDNLAARQAIAIYGQQEQNYRTMIKPLANGATNPLAAGAVEPSFTTPPPAPTINYNFGAPGSGGVPAFPGAPTPPGATPPGGKPPADTKPPSRVTPARLAAVQRDIERLEKAHHAITDPGAMDALRKKGYTDEEIKAATGQSQAPTSAPPYGLELPLGGLPGTAPRPFPAR